MLLRSTVASDSSFANHFKVTVLPVFNLNIISIISVIKVKKTTYNNRNAFNPTSTQILQVVSKIVKTVCQMFRADGITVIVTFFNSTSYDKTISEESENTLKIT